MKPVSRVSLGIFPTPLQEISAERAGCGVPIRLFFKRDDLCGIGFGGNKIRKLEYLLADALERGCDSIVTGGGSQSNQTVAAAVSAAKLGLAAHLVIPESAGPVTRNMANLAGAFLHEAENGQTNVLMKQIRAVAVGLKQEGHQPYIIPPGASTPLGALAYAEAMREMYGRAAESGIVFDHVICCGATGNTYAGVALGTKLYSPRTKSTVIAIGRRFTHKETLLKQIRETETLMGSDSHISIEDLNVHFAGGKGASEPSGKGRAAMESLASSHGILLDPYFTGKAFAGLLELCRTGEIQPGQNVAFLHTGGMVSLLGQMK